MDGAIPILLFFGFLLISIMTILVAGYRQAEAAREKLAADEAPKSSSHFFAQRDPGEEAVRVDSADESVARVERYLKREQRLASAFVSEPSVENLYRRSGRAVDRANVESYLRREQRLSSAFVSEPSVENLYRRSGRLYWITGKRKAHREEAGTS